jgi:excisionase family DNA binding protein
MYTVEEVAEYLHVSPQVLSRWIREGRVRALRMGRNWRIPPDEYAKILREGIPPKSNEQEEDTEK